jgi:lactoylglutathione lyase
VGTQTNSRGLSSSDGASTPWPKSDLLDWRSSPMKSPALVTLFFSCLLLGGLPGIVQAQDGERLFSKPTIDLGVVVSDVEKAVKFYTEAIGFQERQGFQVPGDFAKDAGLTSGPQLDIRVLSLGSGDDATLLKLMQVAGAESKPSDNTVIHSQLGFSYLTIHVRDMNASLEKLEQADVPTVAKTPIEIPFVPGVFLTIVRDPDGNLVELVGPKQ